MNGSQGTTASAPRAGGLRTLGAAVLLGRVVAWAACLLVTVLLGCWLLLAKSTPRDALVLGCALALALLALSVWAMRRSSGDPDPASVHHALAARVSHRAEREPGALPARLRGASALLNGQALAFYGAVMALVVPLALAVGTPTPTGRAAGIASAGAVVRALPVEAVRDVVRDRHRNGSTYHCTVTVTLPPADGAGAGRRVRFRAEFADPAVVGENVHVAYAPGRPDLGAVGDDDRSAVDRELSGRAMDTSWTLILGAGWLFLTAAFLFLCLTTRRDQRFPRRLRGDERTLRASISGYDGQGADQARILLDTTAGPVQLHVHADNARYVDTVGGARGHLVWAPDRNRHGGREGTPRTGAAFVSDAGWFIPGGLAPDYEESARAKADQPPSVDASGESRLLDLTGGWILGIPGRLMNVLLFWTLCVVVLALPVPTAAWRTAVGIAAMAGLLAYGASAAMHQDTAARRRRGDRPGAVSPPV